MAKSESYKGNKRAAFFANDVETRSLNSVIRTYIAMWESSHPAFMEIVREDALTKRMFSVDYIKTNLPKRLDHNNCICKLKKYTTEEYTDLVTPTPEDSEELVAAKTRYASLKTVSTDKYYIYVYEPICKFSASSVYSLVVAAAKNEGKVKAEAEAEAEKKAKKAENK